MPSKRASTVPLICRLCPKKPTFSDVSHMLTHISSKGHLAERFKLNIRAQSDLSARLELEAYENFHQQHDLDSLLATRLAIKNTKQANKDRQNQAKRLKSAPAGTMVSSNQVKDEVAPQEPTHGVLATTPLFRAPVPRMHTWSTAQAARDAMNEQIANVPGPDTDGSPSMRRVVSNFTTLDDDDGDDGASLLDPQLLNATATTDITSKHDCTPAGRTTSKEVPSPKSPKTPCSSNSKGIQGNMPAKSPDSASLKGVLYPGMDIFDSATAEMKRMRNQRKSKAIVDRMIANSLEIEPIEKVYTHDGELERTRHVFDPPSCESSPTREPSPKTSNNRKTALKDVDANVPRGRRGRKTCAESKKERSYNARPLPLYKPATDALANWGIYCALREALEQEHSTTGSDAKKRGFSVFHDTPSNSPGRTESPPVEANLEGDIRPDILMYRSLTNPLNPNYPIGRSDAFGKENVHLGPGSAGPNLMSPFQSPMFGTSNPLYMHPATHICPSDNDAEGNNGRRGPSHAASYKSFADAFFSEAAYGLHSTFHHDKPHDSM